MTGHPPSTQSLVPESCPILQLREQAAADAGDAKLSTRAEPRCSRLRKRRTSEGGHRLGAGQRGAGGNLPRRQHRVETTVGPSRRTPQSHMDGLGSREWRVDFGDEEARSRQQRPQELEDAS